MSAETHNGVAVKNAWKMDNQTKGKEYIIFAKSAEIKTKWMDAFHREKERVAQDRSSGQWNNRNLIVQRSSLLRNEQDSMCR